MMRYMKLMKRSRERVRSKHNISINEIRVIINYNATHCARFTQTIKRPKINSIGFLY